MYATPINVALITREPFKVDVYVREVLNFYHGVLNSGWVLAPRAETETFRWFGSHALTPRICKETLPYRSSYFCMYLTPIGTESFLCIQQHLQATP